eukprot:6902018-Alexandrium_andersonii.AAC.1
MPLDAQRTDSTQQDGRFGVRGSFGPSRKSWGLRPHGRHPRTDGLFASSPPSPDGLLSHRGRLRSIHGLRDGLAFDQAELETDLDREGLNVTDTAVCNLSE